MGLDDSGVGEEAEVQWPDSEEDESAMIQQHYPGSAFPLKVTEFMSNDEMLAMFKRYREAFEQDEREGKRWRAARDTKRG